MSEMKTASKAPAHRYNAALAGEIEARWQSFWEERGVFRAPNPGETGFDPSRPKSYVLDMFPYPSGEGLHVGHPLGYIATDIFARYQRMRGMNVLHSMGFDAFGLPAEQHAIETGTHPRETTERNIERFRSQLRRLGMAHDRRRSVATTDVAFYRWTQWIFLQLFNAWFDEAAAKARPIGDLVAEFESGARATPRGWPAWSELNEEQRAELIDGHRLAYLADVEVNWCPALGTVLANEEVTAEGRSERGNHPVVRRPLRQWMMRITAYAERLLEDLDALDWPEPVKAMQRNWIGRSEGAHVDFPADGESIRVFTTRPDTLFGATYLVLAPEHPLVETLTADTYEAGVPERWRSVPGGDAPRVCSTPAEAVEAYRKYAAARTSVERQAEARRKTGVFIGAHATNPVNGESIPIFIADYVLMEYGTGAIMAVPAHDERDFEFARQFDLPIRDVVYPRHLMAMKLFAERAPAELAEPDVWRAALCAFVERVERKRIEPAEMGEALKTIKASGARGEDVPAKWATGLERLGVSSLAELRSVIERGGVIALGDKAAPGEGWVVNSPPIDGLRTDEAKRGIIDWLEQRGIGRGAVNYKLRDWLFSRQRYWGEPFPIVYEESDTGSARPIALPESMLPVELPELDDFSPTPAGDENAAPRPPLGRATGWAHVTLDLGEGPKRYRRELNTMPQWAGSCWYYLRYLDPDNDERFVGEEAERYWMTEFGRREQPGGVDLYVGGVEHAVLHLLYARFWHKALHDLGHVSTPEPFQKLFNQGYIQAYAYVDQRGVYVPADEVTDADGNLAVLRPEYEGPFFYKGEEVTREFGKMGKSLKNSVTPDEVCEEFGADTLRLYEMSMGPLEQSKPWNPRDIIGANRFLQRVWRNLIDEETGESTLAEGEADEQTLRLLHKTIDGVRRDMEQLGFNTAIAKLIEFNNHLAKQERVTRDVGEAFVLMLAPFAPHIGEELWSRMGREPSIAYEAFPQADPDLLVEDVVELPVQVMGKLRGRITVPADADGRAIEELALADANVQRAIGDKTVRRVIVVPGRMVNIVVG